MTKDRNKRIIEAIEKRTRETLKAPERCREYLIEIGVYNADGTLAKEYGGK